LVCDRQRLARGRAPFEPSCGVLILA